MDFNLEARARALRGESEGRPAPETKETDAGPVEAYLPTVYTDEEQERLLIGYEPVPEAGWTLLRPKTHMRYETQRGDFRRGGFVHNVKLKGKPMIFLETGFDAKAPGYRKWPVALEDLARVWKKRTIEDVQIAEATVNPDVQHRVEIFEQRLHAQDMQIQTIQDEIKKILHIISKLNDKIVGAPRSIQVAAPPAVKTLLKH